MQEKEQVTLIMCGPSSPTCRCNCPDSCGHKFDKWVQVETPGEQYIGMVCSVCGKRAMDHDIWVMP